MSDKAPRKQPNQQDKKPDIKQNDTRHLPGSNNSRKSDTTTGTGPRDLER